MPRWSKHLSFKKENRWASHQLHFDDEMCIVFPPFVLQLYSLSRNITSIFCALNWCFLFCFYAESHLLDADSSKASIHI